MNASKKRIVLSIFSIAIIVSMATFSMLSCQDPEKKNDEKEILSYILQDQTDSSKVLIDSAIINITLKYDADLTKQTPIIQISDKASIQPASGEVVDLSSGKIIYTVTAEDKSTKKWTLIAKTANKPDNAIISFVINDVSLTSIGDTSITLSLRQVSDFSTIKPIIEVSAGASISPASEVAQDFTKGSVKYTVTASDGTVRYYNVTARRIGSSADYINDISVSNQAAPAIMGFYEFYIVMPSGSSIGKLSPVLSLPKGASSIPNSGSEVDFSSGSVVYSVMAENGTKSSWTVYLTYPLTEPDNSKIQMIGRISYTKPKKPVFSAPGVYIKAKFKGTFCDVLLTDEYKWGSNLNFIDVVIDDNEPQRMQLSQNKTLYRLANKLSNAEHTITICKDTEASIGSISFGGIRCEQILDLPVKPSRKIECYGNSITCGMGNLTQYCSIAVDSKWYYAHRAYTAYGPTMARTLNAQYHLTSVSGIGLVQSCCGNTENITNIHDRIFMESTASEKWNFSNYLPDVVTIALGQNDGIIDSALFCSKYVQFIQKLRTNYPNTSFFLLTSPMADDALLAYQKKCLTGVTNYLNNNGDNKVYKVYLSNKLNSGCGSHPDEAQHKITAQELASAVKEKMGW